MPLNVGILRLVADQYGANVPYLTPDSTCCQQPRAGSSRASSATRYSAAIPRPGRAGNANIPVDSAYQMRGVGRKLVTGAPVRWPSMIRTSKRYSEGGVKFRLAMEGKSGWD